jgi:enoyl-CoA hydratase
MSDTTQAAGLVRYATDAGVATITMDHTETRNALSDAMLDELIGASARARDDDAVRCVVLASSHDRVFSSRGDLAGLRPSWPASRRC